jgi:hypothetical protein
MRKKVSVSFATLVFLLTVPRYAHAVRDAHVGSYINNGSQFAMSIIQDESEYWGGGRVVMRSDMNYNIRHQK